MKKLLAIIIAALMICMLASCKKDDNPPIDNPPIIKPVPKHRRITTHSHTRSVKATPQL